MVKNNFFIDVKTPARFNIDFVKKNMLGKICTINSKDSGHTFRNLVTGESVPIAGGVCTKVANDGSFIIITNMHSNDGWESHDIRCYAEYLSIADISCMDVNSFVSTSFKYDEYMKNDSIKIFCTDNITMISKSFDMICSNSITSASIDSITENIMRLRIKKCDVRKFASCIYKNVNTCIKQNDKSYFILELSPYDFRNNVKLRHNKDMFIINSIEIKDNEIIPAVKQSQKSLTEENINITNNKKNKKDNISTSNNLESNKSSIKDNKEKELISNTDIKHKNQLNINEITESLNKIENSEELYSLIKVTSKDYVNKDNVDEILNTTCYIQTINASLYSGHITNVNYDKLTITLSGYDVNMNKMKTTTIAIADIVSLQVIGSGTSNSARKINYTYKDFIDKLEIKKFNTEVIKKDTAISLHYKDSDISIFVTDISNTTIKFAINKCDISQLKDLILLPNVIDKLISNTAKSVNITLSVNVFIDSIMIKKEDVTIITSITSNTATSPITNTVTAPITNIATTESTNEIHDVPIATSPLVVTKSIRVFNLSDNIINNTISIPLKDNQVVCGIVKEIAYDDYYITILKYDENIGNYIDYKCYASDIDINSKIQIVKTDAKTGMSLIDVTFKEISEEMSIFVFNTQVIKNNEQVSIYDDVSKVYIFAKVIDVKDTDITLELSKKYLSNLNKLCEDTVNISTPDTAYDVKSFKVTLESVDFKPTVKITSPNNIKLDINALQNDSNIDIENIPLTISTTNKLYSLIEALKLFLLGYEIRAVSWDEDTYIWWDDNDLQIFDNNGQKLYDLALFINNDWEIIGYKGAD